jgi:hypothetical protein
VGDRLYAAGRSGLAVFDVAEPESPRRLRHLEQFLDGPLVDLAVPADRGDRTLLAVHAKGPAQLLDIASDRLHPIAAYPQTPWFLNTARLPGLLLRLVAGGASITVSEFGAVRTI